MTSLRRWAVLPAFRPASELTAVARAAESAGCEGAYSVQLHSSPFVPLGAAAAVTSTLQLATGIALTFSRSPFETAAHALELDHLSEGRFTLGLGPSVRWWHETLHDVAYDPPLARLTEAIAVIRMVTSGFPDGRQFEGRFYDVDFGGVAVKRPLRSHIPIWVAALRSPLCRLAGQHADGLIGHPCWSLDWARRQVEGPFADGLASSGRARSDVSVNLWLTVAPNPDRAEAINDAKAHVAFYASIAQYEPYFAAHGFGAEARALATSAEGSRPDPQLVTDAMAEAFVICGTPGEVQDRVRSLTDVADSFTLRPPPVGDPDAAAAYDERVAALGS